jgi:hypothetical protein
MCFKHLLEIKEETMGRCFGNKCADDIILLVIEPALEHLLKLVKLHPLQSPRLLFQQLLLFLVKLLPEKASDIMSGSTCPILERPLC